MSIYSDLIFAAQAKKPTPEQAAELLAIGFGVLGFYGSLLLIQRLQDEVTDQIPEVNPPGLSDIPTVSRRQPYRPVGGAL